MSLNLHKYLPFRNIMPRDLFSADSKDDSLVASPETQTPKPETSDSGAATDDLNKYTIHRDDPHESSIEQILDGKANANKYGNLHPYVQTLSISDLESCVALENATFPEHERCSREKVDIRFLMFQAPNQTLFCLVFVLQKN